MMRRFLYIIINRSAIINFWRIGAINAVVRRLARAKDDELVSLPKGLPYLDALTVFLRDRGGKAKRSKKDYASGINFGVN